MSRFLAERYRDLEPYTPGEQPKIKGLIKLNTNESPYPPGPRTLAAVTDAALAAGLRRYNDPDATELKSLLAEKYGVGPENIHVSNGSDDILNFSFQAFGSDGVLFPDVSYGFYKVFTELHGLKYTAVPLKPGFRIEPADYTGDAGMTVLANPNAPTGRALPVSDIEEILKKTKNHVVLIDEAYAGFGAGSCVPLVSEYPNLLVTMTFSKSRSLAGARLGFAIADSELIRDLERLKYSTNPYNVNSITQAAGCAAVLEDDYYRENCRKISETREKTTKELEALGFSVIPSESNFIFVRTDKIGGTELYRDLRARNILVRHFDRRDISDYNRITIGTEEEMGILIQAIREILGRI